MRLAIIMPRPRPGSKLQRFNEAALIGGTQVRFTPLMTKRLTRRAKEMIERSLRYFPELQGKTITIGYTRVHLGAAVICPISSANASLNIVVINFACCCLQCNSS